MPLVKVSRNRQVTIPKELSDALELQPGDYVEITRKGDQLIVRPKAVVDKQDAWFWSKEWQAMEAEADEDIKAGRVKRFDNVEDLIKDLKS